MFTDRVRLKLSAGKGGNGVVAWRREKYIAKGGPAGGDGGQGGSVVLRASTRVLSLHAFRNQRFLRAENGVAGGAGCRRGRNGRNLEVGLPCGTLIKDVESGEILCDLTTDGEHFIICRGGAPGRGNVSFKSATHRAPNYCTAGRQGEERLVEFELKLIADVGLVGFPNAGKSTLLRAWTQLPAKCAPYPFTTLRPNVGSIEFDDYRRVVIADIPGIISGASEDRGLGFEFLRHIERTQVLCFLLDASGIDGRTPWEDYAVLLEELQAYDESLMRRKRLVVLNKMDVPQSAELAAECLRRFPDLSAHFISAEKGEGLEALLLAIKAEVYQTIY